MHAIVSSFEERIVPEANKSKSVIRRIYHQLPNTQHTYIQTNIKSYTYENVYKPHSSHLLLRLIQIDVALWPVFGCLQKTMLY